MIGGKVGKSQRERLGAQRWRSCSAVGEGYATSSAAGAAGWGEVDVYEVRVAQEPLKGRQVRVDGEVEQDYCRRLGDQLAALPVDAPGVQPGVAKGACHTSAACEDFEDEGPVPGNEKMSVTTERPLVATGWFFMSVWAVGIRKVIVCVGTPTHCWMRGGEVVEELCHGMARWQSR